MYLKTNMYLIIIIVKGIRVQWNTHAANVHRMGVADLVKLALWLSQLLKCHCAPMRDEWVDRMVAQISRGNQQGDVGLLVQGIKDLLSVLEAMKLVSHRLLPVSLF